MTPAIEELRLALDRAGYIADDDTATAAYLARALGKPLLIEGDAGVGKTELAKVLARLYETELVRLQCYEGLAAETALYEWNYPKQMLRLRMSDASGEDAQSLQAAIFSRDFLLERPLLRAITRSASPVLLVDEIDRADDGFEAFLLELLSDFQVTIPEFGTIQAAHRPHVVLTSNHTRELGEALRRRCLYLYMEHPSLEKEVRIIKHHCQEVADRLAEEVAGFVAALRRQDLLKPPGVAETLDFARGLVAVGAGSVDATSAARLLGCLLKDRRDLVTIDNDKLPPLIHSARGAGD